MATDSPIELSAHQRARLAQFGASECVDVHCHALFGIDDGPATLEDSLALCRALVRDGITTAIATPHQLGRYEGLNEADEIRSRVGDLQMILNARGIPLRLSCGGEVRVDERIPALLKAGKILTLGDNGRYLLLELPARVMINPEVLLPHLEGIGARVVLAHCERYEALTQQPDLAEEWVRRGAALQVNAGGPLGVFGDSSQRAAMYWLARGWVTLVATDSHSVGNRRPRFTEAIDLIVRQLGKEVARCVCIENPLRVLRGEPLISAPVPAARTENTSE